MRATAHADKATPGGARHTSELLDNLAQRLRFFEQGQVGIGATPQFEQLVQSFRRIVFAALRKKRLCYVVVAFQEW